MGQQVSSGKTSVTGSVAVTLGVTRNPSSRQSVTGSAASRMDTFTVPAGKQWIVKSVYLERANAAYANILLVIDATNTYIEQIASFTLAHRDLDLTLKAGDSFMVSYAAAAAGTLTTHLIYEEATV